MRGSRAYLDAVLDAVPNAVLGGVTRPHDIADGASMLSSVRDALFWAPPWLSGVAVLLIAVICALVAHCVIFMMFGRAFGDRHPFLRTIVWQTKGPLALALVVFALAAALQSAAFSEAISGCRSAGRTRRRPSARSPAPATRSSFPC
jgi:hypothetical protein